MKVLWHKLISRHKIYWIGHWGNAHHYSCECGQEFSVWSPGW